MTERKAWIVIPRWDDFQHRDAARASIPTWIKLYTQLLHDDDYLDLSGHDRAVLHGLWLAYASTRRRLRLDTLSLSRRLSLRVTTATLDRLNDAGWIEISASRPASNHAGSDASLEVEVDKEQTLHTSNGTTDTPDEDGLERLGQLVHIATRDDIEW